MATADELRAAAAIMVGTLLAELPPDRREWLYGCVANQGETFPGAERLQRASEEILREMEAHEAPAPTQEED